MNKEVLVKTGVSVGLSLVLVFILTNTVFYPESPQVRENFTRAVDRLASPIIGYKGEPVREGVDPTPPPSIYQ